MTIYERLIKLSECIVNINVIDNKAYIKYQYTEDMDLEKEIYILLEESLALDISTKILFGEFTSNIDSKIVRIHIEKFKNNKFLNSFDIGDTLYHVSPPKIQINTFTYEEGTIYTKQISNIQLLDLTIMMKYEGKDHWVYSLEEIDKWFFESLNKAKEYMQQYKDNMILQAKEDLIRFSDFVNRIDQTYVKNDVFLNIK